MLPEETLDQARALLAALEARGETLATAESCTGGLIAAALTAIAGSSSVVMAGFVTYSNAAKIRMVGVTQASLAAHGAVSEAVAREMADGALREAGVDVALSCTGIAGPGGATPGKPVGLVFVGRARRGAATIVERHVFPGDRAAVRAATVAAALRMAMPG
ncbi:CinA family protein [Neoroseomonas oryzicola]|uniref:Nicotinamide-nucleotide amidohydrolase family protein n=1 Tax=Neoroseomonas oryzicola TaxID=535904 RepID=A0A9X9WN33_9PROT|nr:nicotinamide-nucleotide amidohydrolase family protein [Neoroseomonas oryzicola]MBR0661743.1 nicotinamide-nucleotide amidohydrolase family protein [Neoroseomonas oryzicola]NKE17323.1 nicotinamide-nucleotide amidohydrolase family protein [Neoroseomonas oryzicola]